MKPPKQVLTVMTWALFAAAGCSSSESTATPAAIGLNQVAVLLPLPTAEERGLLLKPADQGGHGQLLPDFALPAPALVMNEDRATTIANLRVIALRLDPCYPNINMSAIEHCEQLIHLVWQPLVSAAGGATILSTADAAVHTMYRLNRAEFAAFLDRYLQLDAAAPTDRTAPLGVHPGIKKQGLSGTYFAGLRSLLLDFVGADNLARMTYFAVRATIAEKYEGQGWLLSGAEFAAGQTSLVVVATTTDKEQHFGNNTGLAGRLDTVSTFVGDFIPRTSFSDALLPIVGDSAKAATAPLASVAAAVDEALQIENPLLNTLDSVDCASCHVATTARIWAEQNRLINSTGNAHRYTNPHYDLTLTSQTQTRTNSLRGLGYYESLVAISQRTVNDTAAGADFINAHYLGRP